jgi:iron(III) transport system ATP-binding protein
MMENQVPGKPDAHGGGNAGVKPPGGKFSGALFGRKSIGVSLRNVTKIFPQPEGNGEFIAVNRVTLDIKEGQMTTLLGPSGCGKTTTLRMISGFEYPSAGQILFEGTDVALLPPNRRDISMVFQNYALFPHLCVWENIAYGLRVKKMPREEIKERTIKVMELMQLEKMATRFPNQLSGGQQQRVALARAIVIEPKVLLFDEPLSNLDAKLRERMRDEIRSLQTRLGITSLYVTHDQSEAMAISDQIVIMKDGVIAQAGDPGEIYEYPVNKFVANFIGRANFLRGILRERKGETAVVSVGEHTLVLPHPGKGAIKTGGPCSVTFRPESVTFGSGGSGVPARVTRAVYFGSKIEYEAEALGSLIVFEIYNPQNQDRYHPGDNTFINIDLMSSRLLEDDNLKEE